MCPDDPECSHDIAQVVKEGTVQEERDTTDTQIVVPLLVGQTVLRRRGP